MRDIFNFNEDTKSLVRPDKSDYYDLFYMYDNKILNQKPIVYLSSTSHSGIERKTWVSLKQLKNIRVESSLSNDLNDFLGNTVSTSISITVSNNLGNNIVGEPTIEEMCTSGFDLFIGYKLNDLVLMQEDDIFPITLENGEQIADENSTKIQGVLIGGCHATNFDTAIGASTTTITGVTSQITGQGTMVYNTQINEDIDWESYGLTNDKFPMTLRKFIETLSNSNLSQINTPYEHSEIDDSLYNILNISLPTNPFIDEKIKPEEVIKQIAEILGCYIENHYKIIEDVKWNGMYFSTPIAVPFMQIKRLTTNLHESLTMIKKMSRAEYSHNLKIYPRGHYNWIHLSNSDDSIEYNRQYGGASSPNIPYTGQYYSDYLGNNITLSITRNKILDTLIENHQEKDISTILDSIGGYYAATFFSGALEQVCCMSGDLRGNILYSPGDVVPVVLQDGSIAYSILLNYTLTYDGALHSSTSCNSNGTSKYFDVYNKNTASARFSKLNKQMLEQQKKTSTLEKAVSSDERLKKNIKNTKENALEIIEKIPHKTFEWKENDKQIKIGYIAQDMEKIDKNFVIIDNKGEYYINILPILATTTKALQEQEEEIKSLKDKINKLEEEAKNGK